MKIRGHHLWIFEALTRRDTIKRSGRYSPEEFELYFHDIPVLAEKKVRDHISEMYKQITEDPYLPISAVDSLDDICIVCGKNDGTRCIKVDEENNKKVDLRVIKDYCMVPGKSYSSDNFLFKIRVNE